jgi:ribosomal protein S18 acetylase RimI-like enzyme
MADDLDFHLTAAPDEADLEAVDAGLHASNLAAADLAAVQPLAVFVRDGADALVGGLRARTWGRAAEIQQLWVRPDLRRRGIGSRLLRMAERALVERGCTLAYLETFSWQAPALYCRCGFEVAAQFDGMPDGGIKYVMHKRLAAAAGAAAQGTTQ